MILLYLPFVVGIIEISKNAREVKVGPAHGLWLGAGDIWSRHGGLLASYLRLAATKSKLLVTIQLKPEKSFMICFLLELLVLATAVA